MSGRTPLFRRLLETMRLSESEAPSREVADAARAPFSLSSRRRFLELGGAAAVVGLGCSIGADPLARNRAGLRAVNADIGIVGAGIAGLACAYELSRAGVKATLHEANDRVGGRMYSSTDAMWLGQSIERGGELIDTPHKTIQGYANELGLALEEITKPARPERYYFDGAFVDQATMIDEYRVLVDSMRDDLRQIGSPTAASNTPAERSLDALSLDEWLTRRGAPSHIAKLLRVAYTIEYGAGPENLSCLAFLLFAKASRQSKIRLWGNFSDERYHVIGGNQQIPIGLAAKMPGQITFGRKLVAVKKLSDGRIELTFKEGTKTVTARHDAVVLAIPFHLLRGVAFDASLALPAAKTTAIANVMYGNNAKLMIGIAGRPWVEQGSNGQCFTDLPYLQNSWETDPKLATDTHAVITDYTGGALAKGLSPSKVQQHAADFLGNLDVVYPGVKARARKDAKGQYVCLLEHWPSNPLTQGAYTANQPGYFTNIAGNEATPIGNLYFAGETTDSFYSWQGFMEGGALSGLRAAGEIVRDLG